jgi:hypothetical protein
MKNCLLLLQVGREGKVQQNKVKRYIYDCGRGIQQLLEIILYIGFLAGLWLPIPPNTINYYYY